MTTHELRHLNIAEAVCARPRMFTPNGTPAEVIVFLAGCKYGLSTAYANDDSPSKVVEMFLQDVMQDENVEPIDRFGTAIARYESTYEGLEGLRRFAAMTNRQ